MKAAWRAADHAAELLAAARGWRAAGFIDTATFDAIAAEHAAGGPPLGPIWRTLVFLCVVVGVSTATAVGLLSFGVRDGGGVGALLLICGLFLAFITDVVIGQRSFQPSGAEAATSLLAVVYLGAAVFALLDGLHLLDREALRLSYPWCASICALAAWRWGFRLYAGAAAVFLLLLSAQFPAARAVWISLAALLAWWATAVRAARELAPSHRGGVELVRLVALAAGYVAVNYYSVEHGVLEEIARVAGAPRHRASEISLQLAGLGSALYPLGLLVWGLRSRDRGLIAAGVVAAALSLATVRFYVHLAPLWVVLAASGAALAGAALLLERWLRSGEEGERFGFTAAPLHDEGRRERLLPVAAALAMAPEAHVVPGKPSGVTGRGGSFGGGGAEGSF